MHVERRLLGAILETFKCSKCNVQVISTVPLSTYMSDDKPFDAANNDDQELMAFGYKPSFKREFTNLATVSIRLSLKTSINDLLS